MKDRILKVRKSNKLNQEDFAKKLGLTKNYISLIETGNREPSERTIKDICREFRISYAWLTEGTGSMDSGLDSDEFALIDSVMTSDNEFAKKVLRAFAKLDEKEWEVIAKLIDEIKKE